MGWLKNIANSITGNSLIGTAAGAIGSLISGKQQQESQERAAQLQFENWQKTYGIQRRDALADYERNLADQRQLMLDEAGIQKQGLINAGINPANQAGNMTLSAPNISSVNASQGSYNPVSQTATAFNSFADYLQKMSDPLYKAQYDLVQANIRKTTADASKGKSEYELNEIRIQEASETLKNRIDMVQADLDLKLQELANKKIDASIGEGKVKLQAQELDNLKSQFRILAANITSAEAVSKYADETNRLKVKELEATISHLASQTDIDKIQKDILELDKHFKSMGININSELGQIVGIFAQGKGSRIMDQVLSGFRSMFTELASQLPGIIGEVLSGSAGAVVDVAKSGWNAVTGYAGQAWNSFADWGKENLRKGISRLKPKKYNNKKRRYTLTGHLD